MSDTITVREIIHHGDYRNVRTVETTRETFIVDVLLTSPYNGGHTAEWYESNKYVAELIAGVFGDRQGGSFGWANYSVLS